MFKKDFYHYLLKEPRTLIEGKLLSNYIYQVFHYFDSIPEYIWEKQDDLLSNIEIPINIQKIINELVLSLSFGIDLIPHTNRCMFLFDEDISVNLINQDIILMLYRLHNLPFDDILIGEAVLFHQILNQEEYFAILFERAYHNYPTQQWLIKPKLQVKIKSYLESLCNE